nr:hypothetical protein Iba_chr09cCG1960 [Ipomoea batatas]
MVLHPGDNAVLMKHVVAGSESHHFSGLEIFQANRAPLPVLVFVLRRLLRLCGVVPVPEVEEEESGKEETDPFEPIEFAKHLMTRCLQEQQLGLGGVALLWVSLDLATFGDSLGPGSGRTACKCATRNEQARLAESDEIRVEFCSSCTDYPALQPEESEEIQAAICSSCTDQEGYGCSQTHLSAHISEPDLAYSHNNGHSHSCLGLFSTKTDQEFGWGS